VIRRETDSGDPYYVGETDEETAKIVKLQKLVGATQDGKLGSETVGKFNGMGAVAAGEDFEVWTVEDTAKNIDQAIRIVETIGNTGFMGWVSRHKVLSAILAAGTVVGIGYWVSRGERE
jgi:hypothetical protein